MNAYGAHVRGLIDFHLTRNGALVGLEDTYPVGDDDVVRALYDVAFIGVESHSGESGEAQVEEAARNVALALLVANYGPAFIIPAAVSAEMDEGKTTVEVVASVSAIVDREAAHRNGQTAAMLYGRKA